MLVFLITIILLIALIGTGIWLVKSHARLHASDWGGMENPFPVSQQGSTAIFEADEGTDNSLPGD